eukprot:scaffold52618_cov46-Prasinocladus_malaysianus.AAC.1
MANLNLFLHLHSFHRAATMNKLAECVADQGEIMMLLRSAVAPEFTKSPKMEENSPRLWQILCCNKRITCQPVTSH